MSHFSIRVDVWQIRAMPENRTSSERERRKAWDADYRERNRDRRRAYDRERMRRLRAQEDEAS